MKKIIFNRARIEASSSDFCNSSLAQNWPPSIQQKSYVSNVIADTLQNELIAQIAPQIKDSMVNGVYQINTIELNEIVMKYSGYSTNSDTPIEGSPIEYYRKCIIGAFEEIEGKWDSLLEGEDVCGWFSNHIDHC